MYARRVVAATRPAPLFKRSFALAALGANATFARASTAYVTDYQGVLREAPINIPRFAGGRIVRNLVSDDTFASTSEWIRWWNAPRTVTGGQLDPDGGYTAYKLEMTATAGKPAGIGWINSTLVPDPDAYPRSSIWLRADTPVDVRISNGGGGVPYVATIDSTWRRYFCDTKSNSSLGRAIAVTHTISDLTLTLYAWHPQVQWYPGIADTAPGEYVGPSGCQSFATTNGTTVDANGVVTEGTGSPITGIQYLNETGSTNYFLNSFAPATQSVTRAGTHTVSCRGTGSVTLSGGLTGTVTEGNPITGDPGGVATLCTCSGSLAYVQFEPGSVATSPISTTASPVSRAADGLSYSGVPADNETRIVVDGAASDTDDWDGVVDEEGLISRILVYAPGGRP